MFDISPGQPGDLRNQRYREYSRQRQYQTNDILLENRIIFFSEQSGYLHAYVLAASGGQPRDLMVNLEPRGKGYDLGPETSEVEDAILFTLARFWSLGRISRPTKAGVLLLRGCKK